MVRRNFAGTSGIVVDVCGADGLWFDAEELDRVLAWIRSGGLLRAEERLDEERKEVTRREAIAKRTVQEERDDENPEGHWLGKLVEFVLDASGRWR
jgi:Zn-finger nucleic acid-binding protein